jgi:hypothetical protein
MSYEAGRDRRLREALAASNLSKEQQRTGLVKSHSPGSTHRHPPVKLVLSFLVVLVFAWITWPSIHEINIEDCHPNGIAAKLSAMIYGDQFWSVQLAGIRGDLFRAENWDRNLAETQGKIDDVVRQAQAKLDAMYEKYPSLAPTSAQVAADKLRESADEIEMNEARRLASEMMRKQVPILRQCEDTIVARLHKP